MRAVLKSNSTWVDREGVEKPVTLQDIVIIAPYNAQVFEIQRRLPGARVCARSTANTPTLFSNLICNKLSGQDSRVPFPLHPWAGRLKVENDGKRISMAKRRKSSGRMASKGLPNPIDVHVGARVRLQRTLLGLTQMTLAEQMGITFQQVQKYERGSNRVSSSRLFDLCRILGVQIAYFFDEIDGDMAKQSPGALQGRAPSVVDLDQDPAAKRETLDLVRAYNGIEDAQVRRRLTNMIRAIASGA